MSRAEASWTSQTGATSRAEYTAVRKKTSPFSSRWGAIGLLGERLAGILVLGELGMGLAKLDKLECGMVVLGLVLALVLSLPRRMLPPNIDFPSSESTG